MKFIEVQVDLIQLECPLLPISAPYDHNPGGFHRCWTGYSKFLFCQWTEAIQNSPGKKLRVCTWPTGCKHARVFSLSWQRRTEMGIWLGSNDLWTGELNHVFLYEHSILLSKTTQYTEPCMLGMMHYRKLIRAYLHAVELCILSVDRMNSDLRIGWLRALNCRDAACSRTPCHRDLYHFYYLSPRSEYQACYFHHTQPCHECHKWGTCNESKTFKQRQRFE